MTSLSSLAVSINFFVEPLLLKSTVPVFQFSVTMPYTLVAVLSDGFLAGTLTLMSRGRMPISDR